MVEGDTLTVRVQTTPNDFQVYCATIQRENRCGMCLIAFFPAGLLAGFTFFSAFPGWLRSHFELSTQGSLSVSIVLMFFAFVFPIFVSASLRNARFKDWFDPRGSLQRPFEITFSSDGVKFVGDTEQLTFDWKAFLRVQETSQHYFLYVDKSTAYIVPKRDFSSKGEEERFVALVRSHLAVGAPFDTVKHVRG